MRARIFGIGLLTAAILASGSLSPGVLGPLGSIGAAVPAYADPGDDGASTEDHQQGDRMTVTLSDMEELAADVESRTGRFAGELPDAEQSARTSEAKQQAVATAPERTEDAKSVARSAAEDQLSDTASAPGAAPQESAVTAASQALVTQAATTSVGRWSEVLPMPVIPVFTAMLPSGKVLIWDSVGDQPTESYETHDFTRAALFNPATSTSRRVDLMGANIFCAGFVQLENGNVFVAGGNADRFLQGINQTHIFDWRTETWSRGPDMAEARWYPSVAALNNGEAFIIGGGPTFAEARELNGAIRKLFTATTPSDRNYQHVQSAPDGQVLQTGVDSPLRKFQTAGDGAVATAGSRDGLYRDYSSYAVYQPGKVLVTGGGSTDEDGARRPTRTAVVIDSTSGQPIATPTAPMSGPRKQANLTMLADGTALETGGLATRELVNLDTGVTAAELWNPATDSWRTLASASVLRQYHSTAVLLPDGRVFTGGGGICGACQTLGYLQKDAEIFTPPYLLKPGSNTATAARPTVTGAPKKTGYDTSFTVTSPQAGSIAKVAMVRLGATTHAEDQGQRYLPLSFKTSGRTVTVASPANPNDAPPGYYMLFVLNAAGVPSQASMVQVARGGVDPSTIPVQLFSEYNSGGIVQSLQIGAYRSSAGHLGLVGNDAVSSVKVAKGYQATLCSSDRLTSCRTFTAGTANLPSSANDRASSVRVRYVGTKVKPPTNLALRRPVKVTSTERRWLGGKNAVDGRRSTRWSSKYSNKQSIRIDLGRKKSIKRVVLNWERAYGKSFKIQTSNNGRSWSTIYSTKSGRGGTQTLKGLKGSGRYIRMYGTKRGTRWGYSLYEFAVYSA